MIVLSERALLATFRAKAWTAKRRDRAATAFGRGNLVVTRKLLDCPEFDAIKAITLQAAETHRTLTIPWLDGPRGAPRILAVQTYELYASRMEHYEFDHILAVGELAHVYPSLRNHARKTRAAGAYPEELNGRFGLSWSFSPIPNPWHWDGLDMPGDALIDLKVATLRDVERALEAAIRHPYERIEAVVGKMARMLRAYKPPLAKRRGGHLMGFKNSLVTNVGDLADVLPLLDVTGGARLDELARRMKVDLTIVEGDELRQYQHLRNDIAGRAEAILADIRENLV